MNELLSQPVRTVIECIESWHDENGNWYRIYSDGFIEQSGVHSNCPFRSEITINLHKSYSSKNYKVFIQSNSPNDSGYSIAFSTYIKSESSFDTQMRSVTTPNTSGSSTYKCFWYACGY